MLQLPVEQPIRNYFIRSNESEITFYTIKGAPDLFKFDNSNMLNLVTKDICIFLFQQLKKMYVDDMRK
jgi:hypothetical protein